MVVLGTVVLLRWFFSSILKMVVVQTSEDHSNFEMLEPSFFVVEIMAERTFATHHFGARPRIC